MPPRVIKSEGAERTCRMESIDSQIPKKSKEVGFSDKHYTTCKKHGAPYKSHNTHDCHKSIPTVLKSKGMGMQAVHKETDMLITTV